jgi:hypothetical protein
MGRARVLLLDTTSQSKTHQNPNHTKQTTKRKNSPAVPRRRLRGRAVGGALRPAPAVARLPRAGARALGGRRGRVPQSQRRRACIILEFGRPRRRGRRRAGAVVLLCLLGRGGLFFLGCPMVCFTFCARLGRQRHKPPNLHTKPTQKQRRMPRSSLWSRCCARTPRAGRACIWAKRVGRSMQRVSTARKSMEWVGAISGAQSALPTRQASLRARRRRFGSGLRRPGRAARLSNSRRAAGRRALMQRAVFAPTAPLALRESPPCAPLPPPLRAACAACCVFSFSRSRFDTFRAMGL